MLCPNPTLLGRRADGSWALHLNPLALCWILVCFLSWGRNPGLCACQANTLPLCFMLGPLLTFWPWDRGLTHLFKQALTLLYRPGESWICDPPASGSWVAGLQSCASKPSCSCGFINSCWGHSPLNHLCLRYNPTTASRNRILRVSYTEKEMAKSDRQGSWDLSAQAGPHCKSL